MVAKAPWISVRAGFMTTEAMSRLTAAADATLLGGSRRGRAQQVPRTHRGVGPLRSHQSLAHSSSTLHVAPTAPGAAQRLVARRQTWPSAHSETLPSEVHTLHPEAGRSQRSVPPMQAAPVRARGRQVPQGVPSFRGRPPRRTPR